MRSLRFFMRLFSSSKTPGRAKAGRRNADSMAKSAALFVFSWQSPAKAWTSAIACRECFRLSKNLRRTREGRNPLEFSTIPGSVYGWGGTIFAAENLISRARTGEGHTAERAQLVYQLVKTFFWQAEPLLAGNALNDAGVWCAR